MTYEEAKALRRFENYCTCGGYASSFNGRDPRHPHLNYCPQRDEWEEWKNALESQDDNT